MVKFKDFSRPLSVFPVLFKTNLIFKNFSRQSCIFKYFTSLCEPWAGLCLCCSQTYRKDRVSNVEAQIMLVVLLSLYFLYPKFWVDNILTVFTIEIPVFS